jgi:hypothetical protein
MRKRETSNGSGRRNCRWSLRCHHSWLNRRRALVVQEGEASKETERALRRAILPNSRIPTDNCVYCVIDGERVGRREEQIGRGLILNTCHEFSFVLVFMFDDGLVGRKVDIPRSFGLRILFYFERIPYRRWKFFRTFGE